jgi:hypothetical protein
MEAHLFGAFQDSAKELSGIAMNISASITFIEGWLKQS